MAAEPEPADRARALVPCEIFYLYHWRFPDGEEFGLFADAKDAGRQCAGKEGAEVISMAVLRCPSGGISVI